LKKDNEVHYDTNFVEFLYFIFQTSTSNNVTTMSQLK
jgi:hypothetical protein